MSAYETYLQEQKTKKTTLKVFLDNKTMLQGKITDFDENFIILDSCLIPIDKVISIAKL